MTDDGNRCSDFTINRCGTDGSREGQADASVKVHRRADHRDPARAGGAGPIPIVVSPLGLKLYRPSQAVLDLLPTPQLAAITGEDGGKIIGQAGYRTVA